MMTRAKVTCFEVTKRASVGYGAPPGGFVYDAKFYAVSSGSEENKRFFAATPAGEIRLTTIREDHFTPGKEYYLDFTLAEEV